MTTTLAAILIRTYDRHYHLANTQAEYGAADEAWIAFLNRVPEMYGLLMKDVPGFSGWTPKPTYQFLHRRQSA